jgi:hypothetical protein
MKKVFALIATLALLGGVFAQDYADNTAGGNSASLTETVNISIPNRVALHLTNTGFDLNLNDLGAAINDGDVNCFLVRKNDIPHHDFANFDAFVAAVDFANPVSNYPAAVFENGEVAMDGNEYLKGGLACSNQSIVQKFSNYLLGWKLEADVNIPTLSGIKFAIMDTVENNPSYIADGDTSVCTFWLLWCRNYDGVYKYYVPHTTLGFHNPLELDNADLARQRIGKTNGWRDDHITQWFFFDGSEIAGSHAVDVVYTLTGGL